MKPKPVTVIYDHVLLRIITDLRSAKPVFKALKKQYPKLKYVQAKLKMWSMLYEAVNNARKSKNYRLARARDQAFDPEIHGVRIILPDDKRLKR